MNAHAPFKAEVMISHAWAEDVEELVSSLSSWASRIQPLWACDGVPLWCCTFSQYQPEDGSGPSLQQQLDLDPFKSVIHSKPKHGMLVVHTTKADPYDRLCAKCGHPADEERIRAVIESKVGGYERLDRTIKAFRSTLLKSSTSVVAEIQIPWHKYTDRLLQNLDEGLGLDKVCKELSELGLEGKELKRLFTLTDRDGCEILLARLRWVEQREVEREAEIPVNIAFFPMILSINVDEMLARQQFPLKLACALDVRYRRRLQQTEVASSSHTIEKVFENEKREREWNEMKLHHPVLCGQWMGPEGTPYDCGWFAAGLDIPSEYPTEPPKFKLFTKILHPNIGAESGEVCLDILSDQWTAALTMRTLLLSVVMLLAAPEPQDPVNVEAAALHLNHPELFAEKARLWTRTYALPEPPSLRDLGISTKRRLGRSAGSMSQGQDPGGLQQGNVVSTSRAWQLCTWTGMDLQR
eukprot:s103_g24.t2